MKGLFLLICVVLSTYRVQATGRCGCSCTSNAFNPPRVEYLGAYGGVNSSSECSDFPCQQLFTRCRTFSGTPAYSGNFGVLDGVWRNVPSASSGCGGSQCCVQNVMLTDRKIGTYAWVYEGTITWTTASCPGGQTVSVNGHWATITEDPIVDLTIQGAPQLTLSYDTSAGRLSVAIAPGGGSGPNGATQKFYCESGNCTTNQNVDTTGGGSQTSSASKILSNAIGVTLSTIVVVLLLKR